MPSVNNYNSNKFDARGRKFVFGPSLSRAKNIIYDRKHQLYCYSYCRESELLIKRVIGSTPVGSPRIFFSRVCLFH